MKISSTLMPHNGIFLKRGVISYDDNIAPCTNVSKSQWPFDVKFLGLDIHRQVLVTMLLFYTKGK